MLASGSAGCVVNCDAISSHAHFIHPHAKQPTAHTMHSHNGTSDSYQQRRKYQLERQQHTLWLMQCTLHRIYCHFPLPSPSPSPPSIIVVWCGVRVGLSAISRRIFSCASWYIIAILSAKCLSCAMPDHTRLLHCGELTMGQINFLLQNLILIPFREDNFKHTHSSNIFQEENTCLQSCKSCKLNYQTRTMKWYPIIRLGELQRTILLNVILSAELFKHGSEKFVTVPEETLPAG